MTRDDARNLIVGMLLTLAFLVVVDEAATAMCRDTCTQAGERFAVCKDLCEGK